MNTKKFIKKVDQLSNYYCIPGDGGDFRVVSEVGNYGIKFRTGLNNKIINFASENDNPFTYNTFCTSDNELMELIHKYLKEDNWKRPKQKWFRKDRRNANSNTCEDDLPF